MKKALLIALGLCGALVLNVTAADEKKPEKKAPKKALTDDQKKVLKEITDKYDADKDGKLSKEEREKISAEDKEKMAKAGLAPGKKKKE